MIQKSKSTIIFIALSKEEVQYRVAKKKNGHFRELPTKQFSNPKLFQGAWSITTYKNRGILSFLTQKSICDMILYDKEEYLP